MSPRSPWRDSALRFGDVLVSVNEQPIYDPQVLLSAIRTVESDQTLRIGYHRGSKSQEPVTVRVSQRATEISSFWIPFLFSYEHSRRRTEVSFLLGLFAYESTAVAWEFDYLWFFGIAGGDADQLEEVGR